MFLVIIYTLISLGCLHLNFLEAPASEQSMPKGVLVHHNEIIISEAKPVHNKETISRGPEPESKPKTAPIKLGTLDHRIALMKVSFDNLPGWDKADVKKSLIAFQKSCRTFRKQDPRHSVGSSRIQLNAGDWQPACEASLLVDANSEEEARQFFEHWFNPIEFKQQKKPAHGLFTGYYMPSFEGSLKRTKEFTTPIYGLPKDLHWKHHRHYYTREQIDNGVLKKKAPVIAWIKDPIERLFLEIEGSGIIKLDSGKKVYLDYAGENGAPYTSIGKVLIKSGVMNKDNASRKAIKRYLENHPKKINPILHKNKSFVFFQRVNKPMALGAQGAVLTPGYSLAIDKRWIPLGAPLWLNSTKPDEAQDNEKRFQRLMIAQDTGGAIKGLMRGDVYWGSGKKAAFLGEHMKNMGRFWLLLPKYALNRIKRSIAT